MDGERTSCGRETGVSPLAAIRPSTSWRQGNGCSLDKSPSLVGVHPRISMHSKRVDSCGSTGKVSQQGLALSVPT